MKTLRYDQISDVKAESDLPCTGAGITGKNALSLGCGRLAVPSVAVNIDAFVSRVIDLFIEASKQKTNLCR
jgi:hypothetical protein